MAIVAVRKAAPKRSRGRGRPALSQTRFSKWLIEQGLTNSEFADRCKLHRNTVMKWRTGAARPSRLAMTAIRAKFPKCPLLKS